MASFMLKHCARRLSLLRGTALGAVRPVHPLPRPVLSAPRSISVSSLFLSDRSLEEAKERLSVLTEDPGNDVKLKLYGLYKQVRQFDLF